MFHQTHWSKSPNWFALSQQMTNILQSILSALGFFPILPTSVREKLCKCVLSTGCMYRWIVWVLTVKCITSSGRVVVGLDCFLVMTAVILGQSYRTVSLSKSHTWKSYEGPGDPDGSSHTTDHRNDAGLRLKPGDQTAICALDSSGAIFSKCFCGWMWLGAKTFVGMALKWRWSQAQRWANTHLVIHCCTPRKQTQCTLSWWISQLLYAETLLEYQCWNDLVCRPLCCLFADTYPPSIPSTCPCLYLVAWKCSVGCWGCCNQWCFDTGFSGWTWCCPCFFYLLVRVVWWGLFLWLWNFFSYLEYIFVFRQNIFLPLMSLCWQRSFRPFCFIRRELLIKYCPVFYT